MTEGSRNLRCADPSFEISDSIGHTIRQQYAFLRRLFIDPKMRDLE